MDCKNIESISSPNQQLQEIQSFYNELMIFGEPYVRFDSNRPKSLNVFVALLDEEIHYAGYSSMFAVINRIKEEYPEYNVRLIIHRDGEPKSKYLELYEWELGSFNKVLTVNPDDIYFVYCDIWLAYYVSKIVAKLDQRFIYLLPEYIPFVHGPGGLQYFAESFLKNCNNAVYLFHSLFLKNYVVDNNKINLKCPYLWFDPVLADVFTLTKEDYDSHITPRIVWYARPESHNARNLFSFLIAGFTEAYRRKILNDSIQIVGVGAIKSFSFDFMSHTYKIHRKLPKEIYQTFYNNFDIGISAIQAPHPGMVHFEMAASGLATITNEFENRDNLWYDDYGILTFQDLSIDSFCDTLAQELAYPQSYDERMWISENVKLKFPKTWEESLDKEKIKELLDYV